MRLRTNPRACVQLNARSFTQQGVQALSKSIELETVTLATVGLESQLEIAPSGEAWNYGAYLKKSRVQELNLSEANYEFAA